MGSCLLGKAGCVCWGEFFFYLLSNVCSEEKRKGQFLLSEVGISGALSFEFKSIGESFVS